MFAVLTGFGLAFSAVYFEESENCQKTDDDISKICLGVSLGGNSSVFSVVIAVISVFSVFYSSFIRMVDYCKKSSAWSIIPFQQRIVHKYRFSQSVINLICSLPLALPSSYHDTNKF